MDNNGVAQKFIDGDLSFENWEVAGADNTIFVEKVGCVQNCDDADDNNDILEDQIISPSFTSQAASWTTTVTAQGSIGADTSAFGWTYSNANAGLGY